jgi:hypothetical protein
MPTPACPPRRPAAVPCAGALPARGPRAPRAALAALAALAAVGLAVPVAMPAVAQPVPPTAAALFRDADLPLGERLIAEHKCAACHAKRFGGDGTSVYRPKGRVATPGLLRGMVEQCNTELNLGMFPEEVTAVAAVVNRDHYRFD